ncbi:MAG: hypothetical protein GPJ52_00015 [Candidatus Heimdallarchaeota archaeon]|nr:hypothetical protein [Candidatus Heimdallarchaeota archaeon]
MDIKDEKRKLFEKLEEIFSYLSFIREEVIRIYINNPGITIDNFLIEGFLDGINEMTFAINNNELSYKEKIRKLTEAEEHFRLYLLENWVLIIIYIINDLLDYIDNFKKPLFCPKKLFNKFKKNIWNFNDEINSELKDSITTISIKSNRNTVKSLNRLKVIYDLVFDFREKIMNKKHVLLEEIYEVSKIRSIKMRIVWTLTSIILGALISFLISWFIFL